MDDITIALWREWLALPHLPPAITERLWQPLAEGGLGYTSVRYLQHAALVASWKQLLPSLLQTLQLQDARTLFSFTPGLARMLQAAADTLDTALWQELGRLQPNTPVHRHQQKALAALVRTAKLALLLATLPAEELAVMRSAGGPAGGAWLATPTHDDQPLTNDQFCAAARMRLHLPQHNVPAHNQCKRTSAADSSAAGQCTHALTPQLEHLLTCRHGPNLVRRHNALRDTWQRVIAMITTTVPRLEQDLLLTDAQGNPRDLRADLVLPTTTGPLNLDVTVTSALNASAMVGDLAATTAGTAARIAAIHQHRKYAPATVTPLVMEAHGRWGEDALTFLTNILHHAPKQESQVLRHRAMRMLATSLQAENANTLNDYRRTHNLMA
jgi:hypothetical protein